MVRVGILFMLLAAVALGGCIEPSEPLETGDPPEDPRKRIKGWASGSDRASGCSAPDFLLNRCLKVSFEVGEFKCNPHQDVLEKAGLSGRTSSAPVPEERGYVYCLYEVQYTATTRSVFHGSELRGALEHDPGAPHDEDTQRSCQVTLTGCQIEGSVEREVLWIGPDESQTVWANLRVVLHDPHTSGILAYHDEVIEYKIRT